MATCEFCDSPLGREGKARFRCRTCHASYEVREVRHTGRVFYEVIEDPPPDLYNLSQVRKRLLVAATQVMTAPATALELLADTWVELTTYVKGSNYCPERELSKTRAERDAALERSVNREDAIRESVARALSRLYEDGFWANPQVRYEILDAIRDAGEGSSESNGKGS